MSAATDYAASHDAAAAQQSRIFGPEPQGDPWGAMAGFFRLDPNRDPEPNLRIISSYLRPEDVLVDVGGGAGRMCLPMARRCMEVVMVEPSPGMGAEFDASRAEAGIDNARRVQSDWMDAVDIEGDVAFSGCVTYFVRDIVPFVEKLAAAARRRVMITLWSEPPPCRGGPLFRLAHGEEQERLPGLPPAAVRAVGDGYPARPAGIAGRALVGEQSLPQPRGRPGVGSRRSMASRRGPGTGRRRLPGQLR